MASKKALKAKSKLLATLVTDDKREPCAFCKRDLDDEATYGKMYAIGDIQVHYFCALLSCCLVQKGKDTEGLFGFLYHDIVAEVERSKKHRCSYCNLGGASLGCSNTHCRTQFHLPCGREKNAVSLFFGNYKSFCQKHAPKQNIAEHIMAQARPRMKNARKALRVPQNLNTLKELSAENTGAGGGDVKEVECVCVICYEVVEGFPSPRTFWPPCCARDAWFHASCLQRMALSAGMHYLKCPLCNDKDQFYNAVVNQGFYVPDRDAAWELEQNAFAEIYERPSTCSAETCLCAEGRSHDADSGDWDIQLCILCGTLACHAGCSGREGRFVCGVCRAVAPSDMAALTARIEAVIQSEQRQNRLNNARRVMPSRMSLRRTKARVGYVAPTTSQNNLTSNLEADQKDSKSDTTSARLDLNLKPPRRRTKPTENKNQNILKTIQNTMFSPTKLVEEGLNEKIGAGLKTVHSEKVISIIKQKLQKPRPLSEKKRIVNTLLDELVDDILNSCNVTETSSNVKITTPGKNKEAKSPRNSSYLLSTEDIKENGKLNDEESLLNEDESSNSTFELPSEFIAEKNSDDSLSLFETPKKLTTVDIQKDSSLEISENNEVVNIDVVKIENSQNNDFIKNLKLDSPVKKEKLKKKAQKKLLEEKLGLDIEMFKDAYLNEVGIEKAQAHIDTLRKSLESTEKKIKQDKRRKLKRKIESQDGVAKKKAKKEKALVLRYNKKADKNDIEVICSDNNDLETNIDLTLETPKLKKRFKKSKKNKKHKENIKVKIRFRKEKVRLKITKSQINKKIKKKKERYVPIASSSKKLKQCILQYGEHSSPAVLKPEYDVTPKKRNYVKLEKSPDTLVQTSLHSFFKRMPSNV